MHAEALLAPATLAAGWIGQACYFSRFFLQWLASERARRPVVPRLFWWLSLAGSVLVSAYTLARELSGAATHQGSYALLLPAYVVGGAIAARNLALARPRAPEREVGNGARGLDPRLAAAIGVAGALVLLFAERGELLAFEQPLPWLVLGALGQFLWIARFPVQWWLSERAGISHFPPLFWGLSLGGNLCLLAYTLHLGDLLLVLSYVPGPLIQVRNLMLGRGRGKAE